MTRGQLLMTLEEYQPAARDFRRSLRSNPRPSNPSFIGLLTVYAETEQREAYAALRGLLMDRIVSPELLELDRKMGY